MEIVKRWMIASLLYRQFSSVNELKQAIVPLLAEDDRTEDDRTAIVRDRHRPNGTRPNGTGIV